ncbi:MAG: YebC/PmpR family DNA-binding transcriptional regulator [Candidatus Portnoybacteria bacterium]|nr:YebC/PmpR family DNA-binding transcriptional regulator [Candidatus Portnoybacteria bacterium]
MSGHSKWSQIKHKKAITDVKRGKIFSKLSRLITVAARQKGGAQATNSQLRIIVEKAKSLNMPGENIERAIKKGTGELEGAKMEEILIEAYGPGGIALLIEAISDNKNRTLSEVRFLVNEKGGKIAEPGSVNWLFERKGALVVNLIEAQTKKDDIELSTIDCGAEDLNWQDENSLEIYTAPEKLDEVKNKLERNGLKISSFSLEWKPKNQIEIVDEKTHGQIERLMDALEENDDVSEIYSNLK